MLSSICVATTTGLPTFRQVSMIVFCKRGTSSGGHSTPRSPLATMIPSHSSTIFSSESPKKQDGFSIFAMIAGTCPPGGSFSAISLIISSISSGRWTNDRATQSTPISSIYSKSARSLGVRGEICSTESGVFTPLRSLIFPSTSTLHTRNPSPFSITVSFILPSSTRRLCPTSEAAMISGWGSCTRLLFPAAESRSKRNF
mmetsp:Transcript_5056/g.10202  ORF Transcript_5056/g.10202 Transcript_5056/m.10202 type:complete len:200 (-) Transcript_5056:709-1308(-)